MKPKIWEEEKRTFFFGASKLSRGLPALPLLVITLAISGCTPKTGTHIYAPAAELQKIKTLSISVQQTEGFSVKEARNPTDNTGLIAGSSFGLIGVVVGASIDAAKTPSSKAPRTSHLATLPQVMEGYDARGTLLKDLRKYFRESTHIEQVEETKGVEGPANHPDAVLEINLAEWGVRPCLGVGSGEQLIQVGLHVTGKIIDRSGTTVWERDDLYLDPQCYTVAAFGSEKGLLKARVEYALDDFSARTVNRILYP